MSLAMLATCALQSSVFSLVFVSKVHDGDTISVDMPSLPDVFGRRVPVRVRGIDAPELHSKNDCERAKAAEAQEFVEKLLLNRQVTLVKPERDKYFRILASVKIDEDDLGTLLLGAKLAVPYDGQTKPKVNWCKK